MVARNEESAGAAGAARNEAARAMGARAMGARDAGAAGASSLASQLQGGQLQSGQKREERRLILGLYRRILPIQLVTYLVSQVDMLVDSLVGAQFIGTEPMAAIGLYNPMMLLVMGLVFTVSTGGSILAARAYGRGDIEEANKAASVCMGTLMLVGVLLSAITLLGTGLVENLLTGNAGNEYLHVYLRGMGFGFIPQAFIMALVVFLQLMGKNRLPLAAAGAACVAGLVLDLLLAPIGMFGIGLSTSLALLLQMLILLPGFFRKGSVLRLVPVRRPWARVAQIVKLGCSELANFACAGMRSFVVNIVLISFGVPYYLGIMTVVYAIFGVSAPFINSAGSSTRIIAAAFFGEGNGSALVTTARTSVLAAIVCSLVPVVLVIACAGPIAACFIPPDAEAFPLTVMALRLFFPVVVFYTLIFVGNAFNQVQGRTISAVIYSVLGELFAILCVVALTRVFGVLAVWVSFSVAFAGAVLVLMIARWIYLRKVSLDAADLFRVQRDFGISDDDRLALSVRGLDDVCTVSEQIEGFCKARRVSARSSFLVALCAEELTSNIMRYGGKQAEKGGIFLNVLRVPDAVKVIIRDSTAPFDPQKWLEIHHSESPEANIGIRIVAQAADEMSYQRVMGLNVTTIVMHD